MFEHTCTLEVRDDELQPKNVLSWILSDFLISAILYQCTTKQEKGCFYCMKSSNEWGKSLHCWNTTQWIFTRFHIKMCCFHWHQFIQLGAGIGGGEIMAPSFELYLNLCHALLSITKEKWLIYCTKNSNEWTVCIQGKWQKRYLRDFKWKGVVFTPTPIHSVGWWKWWLWNHDTVTWILLDVTIGRHN